MKEMRLLLNIILISIFILLNLFVTGCGSQSNKEKSAEISVSTPVFLDETTVSASGEVIPLTRATLSFQNTARDVQVIVETGDDVQIGDVLVTSNDLQQIAEVEAAEARLADAESALDILERNFATKIEQDAAVANIESAQSALTQALENLRYTRMSAPFSGKVIEIYVNSFEDVSAGAPVILLADMGTQVVQTTDLNEIDVKKISIGNPAQISYDAFPDIRVPGVVSEIRQKSSGGAGVNYTVTIQPYAILNELRWGMSAFVEVDITE